MLYEVITPISLLHRRWLFDHCKIHTNSRAVPLRWRGASAQGNPRPQGRRGDQHPWHTGRTTESHGHAAEEEVRHRGYHQGRDNRDPGRQARSDPGRTGTGRRITSYNVCYTKLLRMKTPAVLSPAKKRLRSPRVTVSAMSLITDPSMPGTAPPTANDCTVAGGRHKLCRLSATT